MASATQQATPAAIVVKPASLQHSRPVQPTTVSGVQPAAAVRYVTAPQRVTMAPKPLGEVVVAPGPRKVTGTPRTVTRAATTTVGMPSSSVASALAPVLKTSAARPYTRAVTLPSSAMPKATAAVGPTARTARASPSNAGRNAGSPRLAAKGSDATPSPKKTTPTNASKRGTPAKPQPPAVSSKTQLHEEAPTQLPGQTPAVLSKEQLHEEAPTKKSPGQTPTQEQSGVAEAPFTDELPPPKLTQLAMQLQQPSEHLQAEQLQRPEDITLMEPQQIEELQPNDEEPPAEQLPHIEELQPKEPPAQHLPQKAGHELEPVPEQQQQQHTQSQEHEPAVTQLTLAQLQPTQQHRSACEMPLVPDVVDQEAAAGADDAGADDKGMGVLHVALAAAQETPPLAAKPAPKTREGCLLGCRRLFGRRSS